MNGIHIRKASRLAGFLIPFAGFILLITFPAQASRGAVDGLSVCARIIIPSLFPFFVLSGMLLELGLPKYFSRLLSPLGSRLFGISGAGMTAFILGLSGGYPLGASVTAELCRNGDIQKKEAERMLAFCNNSGPAFIVGAVGSGIFGSAATGLLLYVSHALAAVLLGILSAAGHPRPAEKILLCNIDTATFSEAVSHSVRNAVSSILAICGFVVFFSVIMELLNAFGLFSAAAGRLAVSTPLTLSQASSLLCGVLELGNGIASMNGAVQTPGNLALCSFIVSWGGISVHFQTRTVLGDTGLSLLKHLFGRLLHGVLSAALTFSAACILL